MHIFNFLYTILLSWISVFLLLFMTKIVIPLILFFVINNYMDILFGLFYFKIY